MKRINSLSLVGIFFVSSLTLANAQQAASKTGALADCKNILSEGCQSYLLQANAADVLSQYKDAFIFEGNKLVCNRFKAKLDKDTKDILEVEFVGFDKNLYSKPDENINWGASMKSVKKQYGEPLEIRTDNGAVSYFYKNFELLFYQSKNYTLRRIYLRAYKTKEEIAASQKPKTPATTEPVKVVPKRVVPKPKAADKNIELILAEMKKAFSVNGGTLIASGATNFNYVREDALYRYTQKSDVYVFAAVSEFDPELSVSVETYPYGDNRTSDDYKTTYDKSRNGNYSVVFMTLNIMPFAEISSIMFKPKCTGDVYWLLFRKRE